MVIPALFSDRYFSDGTVRKCFEESSEEPRRAEHSLHDTSGKVQRKLC